MTTSRRTRGNREDKLINGSGMSEAEAALQENERRWRRDNRGDVTTSKGEDMVEVVRIFPGLREDKMRNVPQGGTCMGRRLGPEMLKIIALLFSDDTYSNPAHGKLTRKMLALSRAKNIFLFSL